MLTNRAQSVLLAAIVLVQAVTGLSLATSDPLPPLLKGISAWSYSYHPNVSELVCRFNSRPDARLQFKSFFPYAGSLEFNKKNHEASLYYHPEKISDLYAATLPTGTLIFPIIDARADHQEFNGWTDEQYRAAAHKVADAIIQDSHAAGVQVDIEPFAEDHLPFYKQLRTELNAGGKYTTMFVGPKNELLLEKIFAACNIVILSGYDLNGENTSVEKYEKLLTSAVARVHKVAVRTQGRYMVGIPAAASWGEYEYIVDPGGLNRTESGNQQEEYVKAACRVLGKYDATPEYLGMAIWQLSSAKTTDAPERAMKRIKMPDTIRPGIWKILESYPNT